MDYVAEAIALLEAAEKIYNSVSSLIAAAKQTGNPLPDEVKQQMADSKAANDEAHALINS